MSKLPIDLSKFRKVKTDQHTSTFQHYEGHEIKIAHSKLSQKMRSQLESLPTHAPKKLKEAPVQKFAEAGMVMPDPEPTENQDTTDTAITSQGAPIPAGASAPTPQYDGALQGPATMPAAPEQSDPFGSMASINQQIQGAQKVGIGQQQEQTALGNQGAQNIEQEKQYQQSAQSNLENYAKAMAPIAEERQKLTTDIMNGHIDPKRYMDNMSTGGHIASAIGLIAAGMGSGLTHGPNLAFQYLQNQIDRDIQSQRDDLGKKQNLLSHNLQKSADARDAYNLTKIQSNDMLSSHLRMVADQTADPVAKARIMQIQGMTDQNTAQLQHQMATTKLQQAAFSGQGGPGMGMALESFPPEMRERAVQLPGGGMRLATTKEGAKEVREQIQTMQPIFSALDRLQALGPSATISGTPANQEAESIRAQLIPQINENAGLKRLSGEDIGNIKNMIQNPTTFAGQIAGGARTQAFKQGLQEKLMSAMGNQLEGGMGSKKTASTGNFGFKPRKN